MYDPLRYKKDFPLLQKLSHKKPFVYLDSAATTAKPSVVLDAERAYYEEYGVNIHRGLYEFSAKATALFQETRNEIHQFFGANESHSTIFTRGSTESSNLLAYSLGSLVLGQGDVVVTTELEHHSTLIPWQEACRRAGAQLRFIPFDQNTGELDLSDLPALFAGAKIVVFTGMTNATGYITPYKEIIKEAKRFGLITIMDAAQFASHHELSISALDLDFFYTSAHKMLGPTGIGVLCGRNEFLEKMPPFLFGGDMIERVYKTYSTYAGLPEKFEAGTPNIAGVLGYKAALGYIKSIGLSAIENHERDLVTYAISKMGEVEGLTRYGPKNLMNQGGVFSFNISGMHAHDIGTILDAHGVAVRSGFHCAMTYMDALGISGTARASFYLYNTKEDIDRLFEGLRAAKDIFR